jgi:hypothetical protein
MDTLPHPPFSPTAASVDGSRFFEDPGWQGIFSAANVPDTASVGVFEYDTGVKDRVRSYEATSIHIMSSSDGVEPIVSAEHLGEEIPATPRELLHGSGDSTPEDQKHFSCAPLQFQSNGPDRSASLLKVVQKVWFGKRMKTRVQTSEATQLELAKSKGPTRVSIPRQITIGRRLRSQKKSDNLRVSSGIQEDSTASHTTLRLVNPDVEEPQPNSVAQDPDLAFLHNPEEDRRFSNGFSEWVKELEEQAKPDGQLPSHMRFPADDPGALRSVLSAGENRFANAETGGRRYAATHSHATTPPSSGTKDNALPPIISMKKSERSSNPPNPGPRTSSKGGIFANFTKSGIGKVPPPVASPSISQAHPSNISKQRKGSESSLTEDFSKSMNPAQSTDTLSRIEVEVQASPTHPTHIDITNVPKRLTQALSIDSGPSGSPPERALPQLPEGSSVEGSQSRGSSRKRHSRKQSKNNLSHAKDRPSISSLSTVRGASPVTTGGEARMSQDHTWRSRPDAPEGVAYIQSLDSMSVDQSTTSVAADLRSLTSIYSHDASSSAAGAFMEKQAQKVARADLVKAKKQRDMTSQAPIEEEDEIDTASTMRPTPDPLDQFPNVPNSRPASRSSTRRARSPQRAHSTARRVPRRGIANQTLTASGIMVVADAQPFTPKLRTSRTVSTKSHTAGSPLREDSLTSLRHKSKHSLPKRASQCSIRSHISASALAVNGAHTPPSSPESSEADAELHVAEPETPTTRRAIEKLNADMTMQGHQLKELQQMMTLLVATATRSRSQDISKERPFAPPSSFCFHSRRAMSSLSSTAAASDMVPGPTVVGDESADEDAKGQRHHRLSGALQTTKIDSMLEQMGNSFGVATIYQNPVRIERIEGRRERGGGKKGGRILWSRGEIV